MLRVGVLGWGAIGRTVGEALVGGEVPGAELSAVGHRTRVAGCAAPVVAPEELAAHVDVVVEAAGQGALSTHGEAYLGAGCRLLVVSVGALADDDLFTRLQRAGADRLHLATGAIGGLDLLRAAARMGSFDGVTLTTTKRPPTLLQGWMDDAMATTLRRGRDQVVVFDGEAREAVRLFPQSVNVAATLALAVGSWDLVRVRLIADPAASLNRHEIAASGPAGNHRFVFENNPSADNPRTSGVVAHSVLHGLATMVDTPGWRLATG